MEVLADVTDRRTHANMRALMQLGLIEGLGEDAPTSYCSSPGLRTDTLRSAQRAADATGVVQHIQYTESVNIESGSGQMLATFHTWVLPDATRRQAILAKGPTLPVRFLDIIEEKVISKIRAHNARNKHHHHD